MKTLWQALTLLGASLGANGGEPILPTTPQFFALSVPDAEKSARWYQQAFGLKVLEVVRPAGDNGLVLILNSNELLLEIAQPRGAVSPGAEVIGNRHLTHGIFKVGFYVADLESAVTRLRAMNANFETGIVDVAKLGFRFVLLRDPDGNYVQLFGALGS